MGKIAKNGVLPETIIGGDFNLPGIQWNDPMSIKHNPQYGLLSMKKCWKLKTFLALPKSLKNLSTGLCT